ncbi:MAG: protease modulator HflC [Methylicorpusculum sp.]|uniref:protease modulator HflC n=3 Tax=Methylicorpusculum sp. TaxID=2713644 RepID=UPI002717AADE|nr:protease modulator HflC [Methylicorpusculum sp.]MDO8843136.1 protease modulator HflC [Methylicorpusculum sp.]MDO8938223.1 protease modulator HflC [Methylicorpusculum sp.]MDO9240057.1 protease modulator HflC [Methylicorpusculum sp.]MDP2177405.1 protease modulator HflC [Methylicorpusculum sp.]MDP2202154.1 protease modulator HflC [Methylicorpusculum sp.]
MMQNKILIGIAAVLFLGIMCIFTVSETEKAIKFQLGEIVKDDYEPGLYFKLPIVNNVKKFDSRIQTMDSKPERFLTAEKKNVIVDSFVKWRIGDVKTFYTVVAGDINQANLRLDQIIKDAFRSEFSKREIKQLVSTDRKIIRDILISKSREVAANLGLEIIDVQVKRIDLPSEVSSSVYLRMEAERERVAREFRSQGSEAAERIRADADRQRVVTLANAYKEAEKLRGEGDARSAEIYAKAYTEDPEFYSFYRSLNAYRQTFNKPDQMLVIDPESDFFRYFKSQK